MKPLFTPGATLCPKKIPDILSCSSNLIANRRPSSNSFLSTNRKQVQVARNNILNPKLKRVVYGTLNNINNINDINNRNPTNNSRLSIGRIVEGQLGGILGRPRNF